MHELSITRNVVAIVRDRSAGRRVTRVKLEIGRLSGVMPEAVRFCFDICAADTPLEGAALEIDEIAGLGCCNDCGAHVTLEMPAGRCPGCGAAGLRLIAGQELNIREMEVEASCA